MSIKIYLSPTGPWVHRGERGITLPSLDWDLLFSCEDPINVIRESLETARADDEAGTLQMKAPVNRQEIWAAGVTYLRSRDARMEEAAEAGGGTFYDRVYDADRPELFFKSTAARAVGYGQNMQLRRDSKWAVPEPELTVAVNSKGRIFGYTIGNDLSCRDIEGENPLYLPQAKTWQSSASVGPGILVSPDPLPPSTEIKMTIERGDDVAFEGSTSLDQMKRDPQELVDWLYREMKFSHGCLLMTGTGIIPPDEFALQRGDLVHITIDPIGTLTNPIF